MIWFCSDTHYAHKNIVRGTSEWTDKSGCRDFDTFTEHNDWVVNQINAKVQYNDVLQHLGDWSFGGIHRITEFRQRLNCGDIHLILGNHDHHLRKIMETPRIYGFHSIRQYAELEPAKGVQVVLFHYPIESWISKERGAYHLHGHTHGKTREMFGRYEVCPESHFQGKSTWLLSLDELVQLPKANEQRHATITGGNKFGT